MPCAKELLHMRQFKHRGGQRVPATDFCPRNQRAGTGAAANRTARLWRRPPCLDQGRSHGRRSGGDPHRSGGVWIMAEGGVQPSHQGQHLPQTDTVQSGLLTTTARLVAYQCDRRHALRAGPATFSPFQRQGKAQNHCIGNSGFGRDHLFQHPRPDRNNPQ